ncbi:MAG: magnesium transporter [Candidatus Magnetomorum sp.]|nr:magnesium transporter [Candidatus Magnetomorum sp.]
MEGLGGHTRILIDSIKRLLRRGALGNLKKIINKSHAADLSVIFRSLSIDQQLKIFHMINEKEKQGILLSELDKDSFLDLTKEMSVQALIDIFEFIPSDDLADMIARLPHETADQVLEGMRKENSQAIEDLLRYDDKTAGGIMVPNFYAIQAENTAQEAISSLQKEHKDVEMPFYLYVIDEFDRLVGVCSLRQLVVVKPETLLKDFMSVNVLSVRTDMDQEEVAKIVARYDILAVPVVDENHKLVGIITVDDVIDIIREEATEDILKMVGAGEEFAETKSILGSIRSRLPWLFASWLGGIMAFFIIGHFEHALSKLAYLASFIPIIMGMGGNVGTQSSTIVVRGIATGRINIRDISSVVLKELAVGFLLGAFYGFLLGTVAFGKYNIVMLGLVVGLSVISSMTLAALVGSFVPMVLARVHIDPAIATGPFVTTSIDIVSVYFYFQIAMILLGL